MATIDLTTNNRVHVLESVEQLTLAAGEAIVAGAPVRLDTTTGRFTNSNASSSGEARTYGIATRTVPAGLPVTAVRRGVLSGWTFGGTYDADVYLSDTDGRLADASGTVSKKVGRVIPLPGQTPGNSPAKGLVLDL